MRTPAAPQRRCRRSGARRPAARPHPQLLFHAGMGGCLSTHDDHKASDGDGTAADAIEGAAAAAQAPTTVDASGLPASLLEELAGLSAVTPQLPDSMAVPPQSGVVRTAGAGEQQSPAATSLAATPAEQAAAPPRQMFRAWEIDFASLRIFQQIGVGAFGTVSLHTMLPACFCRCWYPAWPPIPA